MSKKPGADCTKAGQRYPQISIDSQIFNRHKNALKAIKLLKEPKNNKRNSNLLILWLNLGYTKNRPVLEGFKKIAIRRTALSSLLTTGPCMMFNLNIPQLVCPFGQTIIFRHKKEVFLPSTSKLYFIFRYSPENPDLMTTLGLLFLQVWACL
jgi:hypothetical protein